MAATPIHPLNRGSIISRAAKDSAAQWRMVKASQTPIGNPKTAIIGSALTITGSMFPTTPWSPNRTERDARWFGRYGLTIKFQSGASCRAACLRNHAHLSVVGKVVRLVAGPLICLRAVFYIGIVIKQVPGRAVPSGEQLR